MKDNEITINDLVGEQRELAEVIGLKSYISLVKVYGGTTLYIAKYDKIENIKRDRRIAEEFNGHNHKYLAIKYNLSDRAIRNILAEARQPSNQLKFDENI